jgi:D-aminoacyl-tRNA deacylase
MKALIQRVSEARVAIEGKTVGEIDAGLLILVGVAGGDDEAGAEVLAKKCAELRIFEDGDGKMNLSVVDVGGELLAVSQFTLIANCRDHRSLRLHHLQRQGGYTNTFALV